MHVTKRLDLPLLTTELTTAGVAHRALGTTGTLETGDLELFTYDPQGALAELPPEAGPVVDAHVAPPLLVEYAGATAVHAIVRTTDATPLEVFRFPTTQKRLYQANLTISGVDAVSFVAKVMEGRFVWRRNTGNALMVGITVVSDIHDTAAASWAPNAAPVGTDVLFTVAGAAGRTIDWLLVGQIDIYAPAGLST